MRHIPLPPALSLQHQLDLGPQVGEAICRDALWQAVCGSALAHQGAAVIEQHTRRVVALDAPGEALAAAGWQLTRVLDQPCHRRPVPPERAMLVLKRTLGGPRAPSGEDLARRLWRSRHLLYPADAEALRMVLADDGAHRSLRLRRRRPGGGVLLHDMLNTEGLAAWMGIPEGLAAWLLPGIGDLPPGTRFCPTGPSWDERSWTLRAPRGTLPGIVDQHAHLVVRSRPGGAVRSADLCLPAETDQHPLAATTSQAVRERLTAAGLLEAQDRQVA